MIDLEPCDYCIKAAERTDFPLYRAQCKACAVRSLSLSPEFYAGGLDGGNAKPYRKLLGQIFGDDWRQAHDLVLAERDRIAKLRQQQPT